MTLSLAAMEAPFLLAAIWAAFGLAITFWIPRQPTRTRISIGLIYLAVYSYLLTRAGIIPTKAAPAALPSDLRFLSQSLQLFWWFVFARCVIALGRVFLLFKHKLAERQFATDLLAALVYLAVFFSAVGFVFDLPVSGLIATSGAVAIVLGLALQSTASDLFSGIALNIEGSYRIGDWISLEGNVQGRVKEITWRATHIVTGTQDTVVVPNSVIAKSRITNYSFPVRVHGVSVTVSLEDRMPPAQAIEMLEQAVLNCRRALHAPPPSVQATGIGAGAIDYAVAFFVESIDAADQAKSDVLAAICRHADWAGIAIARQRRDLSLIAEVRAADARPARTIVDRFPVFASLSDAERNALLAELKRQELRRGEFVFEQGQPGQSLFLLERGVVGVSRNDPDGNTVEIARVGPGQYFGEGAPRRATARALTNAILYELVAADAAALLKSHPELQDDLAGAVPRDLRTSAAPPAPVPSTERLMTPIAQFLARIGKFLPH